MFVLSLVLLNSKARYSFIHRAQNIIVGLALGIVNTVLSFVSTTCIHEYPGHCVMALKISLVAHTFLRRFLLAPKQHLLFDLARRFS